jgi:hypothetical protein
LPKKQKQTSKKKKVEVKSLVREVEIDGLAEPEQPLLYFGPPPAIKQLYKSTDFDKDFHPFDMLAHMRAGHSRSEIVAAWGITYSKFNEWLDNFPEMAEAYAVGKPAFDAYYKQTLRLASFGQMPKVREYSLHLMLKTQVGVSDQANHEFGDGQGAEVEFVDDNE